MAFPLYQNQKSYLRPYYKFSVPYNGDLRFVDIIISDFKQWVDSFYGSFGIDEFGGGRAQKKVFIDSFGELKRIIKKLSKHNINFIYVINNTNLMNREFNKTYIKKYFNFLKKLKKIGVKIITLSNPYLIKVTKEKFPDIQIQGSVNLKIRSKAEVIYALGLGCDEITLHYDLLKNIPELIKIRQITNKTLRLIPNDIYIMNCPWQKGHTRMQGAHSRIKNSKTPYFSYYRNKCVNLRHYYPEEIFKAMWFPPEHIDNYINIGYKHFKLLDRLATTHWNIRSLKAYIDKKSPDNLELILGTYGRASNIEKFLPLVSSNDTPYPIEKLELVPKIKNINHERSKTLLNIWYSPHHQYSTPLGCNSCEICKHLSKINLSFPKKKREIAKKNNRIYQKEITKLEFIEKLNNSYVQRINYE